MVLLDVTMPRLDGISALEQIRAARPDMPAILMSGLLELDPDLVAQAHTEFAPKPYDPQEIAMIIRRLIDAT